MKREKEMVSVCAPVCMCVYAHPCVSVRDSDKERKRLRERETERGRESVHERDRQTDRYSDREKDRKREFVFACAHVRVSIRLR